MLDDIVIICSICIEMVDDLIICADMLKRVLED